MWLEKVTTPSAGAGSPLAAHSHLSFPFLPSQMSRSVLTEVARRWILGQVLSVGAGCPVTPLRQRREPCARSLVSRGRARRSPGPHQDRVVFLRHAAPLPSPKGVGALHCCGVFLLCRSWVRTSCSCPSLGRATNPSEPAPVFQSLGKSIKLGVTRFGYRIFL